MTNLPEYLIQKHASLLSRRTWMREFPDFPEILLTANACAEGRGGIRRIRIRDLQVISDSPENFVGYDLGPTFPELLLGSLSSCLVHTYLIQAADLEFPLQAVAAEVTAPIEPRAGNPGSDQALNYPHSIKFSVKIAAEMEDLSKSNQAVQRNCPILALLRRGTEIEGFVTRVPFADFAYA